MGTTQVVNSISVVMDRRAMALANGLIPEINLNLLKNYTVLLALYECWKYNKDFPNDEIMKENLGEFYRDTQDWNIYKKSQYSGEVLSRWFNNVMYIIPTDYNRAEFQAQYFINNDFDMTNFINKLAMKYGVFEDPIAKKHILKFLMFIKIEEIWTVLTDYSNKLIYQQIKRNDEIEKIYTDLSLKLKILTESIIEYSKLIDEKSNEYLINNYADPLKWT